MLEELVLSENSLEEIPGTIATMAMLRVLKVNNYFISLFNVLIFFISNFILDSK